MAAIRRNREIKRRCPDFRPIRRILRGLGARASPPKTQVDTYYRLPNGPGRLPPNEGYLPAETGQGPRRLKLRVERGKRQLIYYTDVYADGLRAVRYVIADAADPKMRALLDSALGVSVVVRKRREVWRLPRVLFNLDRIESVGQVFETEVMLRPGEDSDERLNAYLTLFAPHLGEPIDASNEDLVLALAR